MLMQKSKTYIVNSQSVCFSYEMLKFSVKYIINMPNV